MSALLRMFSITTLLLWNSVPALAGTQIIHAGKLLSMPGEAPKTRQTIVIENDKIIEVRDGYVDVKEFGKEARVIDLKNSFVMPGLMDMHVHLQGELGPKNDSEDLKMSAELIGMRSSYFAMKILTAGFTTVRDLGSEPRNMYALRDAINN